MPNVILRNKFNFADANQCHMYPKMLYFKCIFICIRRHFAIKAILLLQVLTEMLFVNSAMGIEDHKKRNIYILKLCFSFTAAVLFIQL